MCNEIVTKDGQKLKPDRMMDYGNEKDYIAYVGNVIYVKCSGNIYEALEDKK